MQAVADIGGMADFDRLIGTDDEYLTCCGVVGLGAMLADDPGSGFGKRGCAVIEARLRDHAADAHWRVREAVAMALQRLGEADAERLEALVRDWLEDPRPLVVRASVAGVCEPRLLKVGLLAAAALEACARATGFLAALPVERRRLPDARTLRQALGYCWSVAVAGCPERGLAEFESLTEQADGDSDLTWIVRENRKKKRLAKLLG
jgi:hypothetical protein